MENKDLKKPSGPKAYMPFNTKKTVNFGACSRGSNLWDSD